MNDLDKEYLKECIDKFVAANKRSLHLMEKLKYLAEIRGDVEQEYWEGLLLDNKTPDHTSLVTMMTIDRDIDVTQKELGRTIDEIQDYKAALRGAYIARSEE